MGLGEVAAQMVNGDTRYISRQGEFIGVEAVKYEPGTVNQPKYAVRGVVERGADPLLELEKLVTGQRSTARLSDIYLLNR